MAALACAESLVPNAVCGNNLDVEMNTEVEGEPGLQSQWSPSTTASSNNVLYLWRTLEKQYIPLGSLNFETRGSFVNSGEDWHVLDVLKAPVIPEHPKWILIKRLAQAAWIRADHRRHQKLDGWVCIRIWVLPDDVGRSTISREDPRLRKALWELIQSVDKTALGWQGCGSKVPEVFFHRRNLAGDESLFYIFNTLQNPEPSTAMITDPYARDAVHEVMSPGGEVQGLRTKLFRYQQRSIACMIQRETHPARVSDPRFDCRKGPTGLDYYLDQQAGCILSEKREYDEARGGILAETMGVGKTLICLSLILATKGFWPKPPPEQQIEIQKTRSKVGSLFEMAASATNVHGIPWKASFESLARNGETYNQCLIALRKATAAYTIPPKIGRRRATVPAAKGRKIGLCNATIVVVPANLLAQWQYEIDLHVEPGYLHVLVVEGNIFPLPAAQDLLEYDLILIERSRFEKEITYEGSPTDWVEPSGSTLSTAQYQMRSSAAVPFNGCSCAAYELPHTPLKCLHFLRLIVDEGHNFASGGKTQSVIAMQKLLVERRWIVSGTPGHGLVGAEVDLATKEAKEIAPEPEMAMANYLKQRKDNKAALAQETRDLEKLGNIVVNFLGLQPWANQKGSMDQASWNYYVMPNQRVSCRDSSTLRNIMESLFIRHRIETVDKDLQLPPLYNKVVYLKPCFFDKISINLFLLQLISNAVTSERVDKDYMFHPANRGQLDTLINNLRQSGFFWTGFKPDGVAETLKVSKAYLDEDDRRNSDGGDIALLNAAIEHGRIPLNSELWLALSHLDEMGFWVEDFPKHAQQPWSLAHRVLFGDSDGDELCSTSQHPLIIGSTPLQHAISYVNNHSYAPDPAQGLGNKGADYMSRIRVAAEKRAKTPAKTKTSKANPAQIISPSKIIRQSEKALDEATGNVGATKLKMSLFKDKQSLTTSGSKDNELLTSGTAVDQPIKSALKKLSQPATSSFDSDSVLNHTRIMGTVSAKLSYLMDRVAILHTTEKILVFYEGDHIAYYIAQALELMNVAYLIYANSLNVSRRNAYMVTFTTTPKFRVMLMDLRHASHGLHIACASRVFFVNPVWQPSIEAQAIKRAHRIGQTKPVYVETLVLEGTLEDEMLKRRKNMTAQEQMHASKSLLDDDTMGGIVRRARFLPFDDGELGDERWQLAPLSIPQKVFGRREGGDTGFFDGKNQDEGIVSARQPSLPSSAGRTGVKRKAGFAMDGRDLGSRMPVVVKKATHKELERRECSMEFEREC
ncbi:hypothetical protein MMC25_002718 [Agyrium rufum]|nr:hypothetical protein [Agyrium rufum]